MHVLGVNFRLPIQTQFLHVFSDLLLNACTEISGLIKPINFGFICFFPLFLVRKEECAVKLRLEFLKALNPRWSLMFVDQLKKFSLLVIYLQKDVLMCSQFYVEGGELNANVV